MDNQQNSIDIDAMSEIAKSAGEFTHSLLKHLKDDGSIKGFEWLDVGPKAAELIMDLIKRGAESITEARDLNDDEQKAFENLVDLELSKIYSETKWSDAKKEKCKQSMMMKIHHAIGLARSIMLDAQVAKMD